MEIIKGVYHIKIPMPETKVNHVNAYLLEGDDGNLLIDTGWNTPEAFTAFKQELLDNGFQIKDITYVAITHLHPDHYGLAGRIKQISGATIAMGEKDAALLYQRYSNVSPLLESMTQFLTVAGVPNVDLPQLTKASMPALDFVVPCTPDERLNSESTIEVAPFEFKVMMTPGHSPGHICLYEPNRKYLFTGDHVLSDISPNISLHPQSGENPLGDYLSSLQALTDLEVKFVFPGHGAVFSGLNQKIEMLFRHHKEREWEILKSISKGQKTAYQIAQEIPWMPDDGKTDFKRLSAFDRRLAVLETLAHLQYLIVEGKITKTTKEGIDYYESLVMP